MALHRHIIVNNAPIQQSSAIPRLKAERVIDMLTRAATLVDKAAIMIGDRAISRDLNEAFMFLVERIENVTLADD